MKKRHTMPFKHHLLRTAHLSFFNEWAPQVQNPISLKVGDSEMWVDENG